VKFVHVTYHFEYTESIEKLLDEHEIRNYNRYPMMEGRDHEGKHFGTQVHPGNVSVVQAQVPDRIVDEFMEDLKQFKESKQAHEHLEALVLPIERRLE
jgi:Fic family protein